MSKVISKIFGMFDKIDDIVYEPVKLVCDALRQPLKQIEHRNEKDKAAYEQALKEEQKRYDYELEQMKKDREMHRSIEQKKLEEELNQMVIDNDLARREKMIQMEAQYREKMAKVATEIEQILVNLTQNSREQIFTLYERHKKNYIEVQQAYTDAVYDNVARMKQLFPGDDSRDAILQYMIKYIEQITQESINFSLALTNDMNNVLGRLGEISDSTSNLAVKYLAPALPNEPALSEKIINGIEQKS